MRTPRDELIADIIKVLANAYGDGGLTAEQEFHENLHNAQEIVDVMWRHVEPFVIDNNGRMVFDYGMLKHTLGA